MIWEYFLRLYAHLKVNSIRGYKKGKLVKTDQISSKVNLQKILLNLSLLMTSLVFIAILFLRIQHVSVYTVDLFGFEQDEIYTLQQVLSDQPIYNNPEKAPFSITQKTPFYHILIGGIGKIAQIDPTAPFLVYILNRGASLVLAVLSCLVVFLILFRIIKTPLKLSLILSFLMFIAMEGHMFTRPDSLFSFSFLATIAFNLLYVLHRKNLFFYLSILFGIGTIFVKQTGIILPIIILAYILFFEKDFRKFLIGVITALGSGIFLLFFLSNGQISTFLSNTIGGLNNGIDARWFYDFIYKFTYQKFALFFIIGIYCCWEWLSKKEKRPLTNFLCLALILDFVFTHFISLKWGATPSYFSEFVHLSIIAFAVYYQQVRNSIAFPTLSKISFLVLVALIPLLTSGKRLIVSITQSDQSAFNACENLRDYLEEHYTDQVKEWVLTDDELLKLYLFQTAILPQEDISFRAYTTRQFDYTKYFEYIRTGKIPLLITRNSLSDLEQNAWYLFDEFSEYYRKAESIDGFNIYLHKTTVIH